MLRLAYRTYQTWQREGATGVKRICKHKLIEHVHSYKKWVKRYDTLTSEDREAIRSRIQNLRYRPVISVLMPVYDVKEIWLRRAIESVLRQLYPEWELCIADDHSSAQHVQRVLEECQEKDSRIKMVFRQQTGHISRASNDALELATGEFIALLDHDDQLSERALYMVAEEVNAYPLASVIYSDEDKINECGHRYHPFFKPDWSPDLFHSLNLISHLGVYRTKLVRKIGGFRIGFEGSQDYDLALRCIEHISERQIRHIPHVLYHWRALPGSVARAASEKDYACEAARKAVGSHLTRLGVNAKVRPARDPYHRVVYSIPPRAPLVSIVVCTRGKVAVLRQFVHSLLTQANYDPFELLIVYDTNCDLDTLDYFDELRLDDRVNLIFYEAGFNYAAMNNAAVLKAKGEIVSLLNEELEVASSDWLTELTSHAMRPEIGIVGARIDFPNNTIKHAGIILGVGGVSGYAYRNFPQQGTHYFAMANLIRNYSAVAEECVAMRRQVFLEVGGLDETFGSATYSSLDLCLRLRTRGYRILWTPYAQLRQIRFRASIRKDCPETGDRSGEDKSRFATRWAEYLVHDPYYSPNLSLSAGDFALAFPPRATRPWMTKSALKRH